MFHLPGMPDGPGIFVVVGMMACFGSVAHAPLAVLTMVAEMTGSFSVVPGAIIAVGIASLLMSRTKASIYRAQRLNRENAEASRQAASSTDHCHSGPMIRHWRTSPLLHEAGEVGDK
jgi:chloride channel protein, CIC family